MKNHWKLMVTAVAMLALVGVGYGQTFNVATEAQAPACIVANQGTSTVTIVISGNGTQALCTVDGALNPKVAFTNMGEFATELERATNSAGVASLVVNRNPSLAADTAAGKLANGTYSLVAGSTTNKILWSVPAADHFDVYGEANYQPLVLQSIFGNPGGTGNVTLSVYVNQSLAWQTVLVPGYTLANDGNTNIVVTATGLVGGLPIEVGLPIQVGQKFFIRAARATDATSGSLGYVVEPWKQ